MNLDKAEALAMTGLVVMLMFMFGAMIWMLHQTWGFIGSIPAAIVTLAFVPMGYQGLILFWRD